jgi:hypothetical protein
LRKRTSNSALSLRHTQQVAISERSFWHIPYGTLLSLIFVVSSISPDIFAFWRGDLQRSIIIMPNDDRDALKLPSMTRTFLPGFPADSWPGAMTLDTHSFSSTPGQRML